MTLEENKILMVDDDEHIWNLLITWGEAISVRKHDI